MDVVPAGLAIVDVKWRYRKLAPRQLAEKRATMIFAWPLADASRIRTRKSACIPRLGAGGFFQFAKQILSADRYTGLQIRWTNNRQRRLGHDQFDPEGIPASEIRRRVRLAQCVHAGLFRSGGCFGETRQLKYDP